MAHPLEHAKNSARKFGGVASDYLCIHQWFDESKAMIADVRHRALRHHSEGIILAERIFGVAIRNSEGKNVPVRYIGEQHVREDLGRIPSFLLGTQDRYRNTVEIDRDSPGNITQVTSSNGRRITLQYDSVRHFTEAQDNAGRTVSYTYDSTGPTGRLSTVTDAKGGVRTYTYGSNDNMPLAESKRIARR
jgi:YD repeat-containing protein